MEYTLCRRDRAELGQQHDYCCKSIKTKNALNWCDDCRARLPMWPKLERHEAEEILRDLEVGMPVDGGARIKRDLLRDHEVVAYDAAIAVVGGR